MATDVGNAEPIDDLAEEDVVPCGDAEPAAPPEDGSDPEKADRWARLGFGLGLLAAVGWLLAVALRSAVPLGWAVLFWVAGAIVASHGWSSRRDGRRGGVGLAAYFGGLLALLLLPIVNMVREDQARSQVKANYKRVVEAMWDYANDHENRLPPAVKRGPDGRPLHSWRVLLLPYLGEEDLYRQFRLDERWDSPHNRALLPRMPAVYAPPPGAGVAGRAGETFLQAAVGPQTAFGVPEGPRVSDFQAGTSNVVILVEALHPVPWTQPADADCDPSRPLPLLGGVFAESLWSRLVAPLRRVGFHGVRADGTASFFRANADEAEFSDKIDRIQWREGGVDW
jgi:hypothetical protein